MHTVTIDTGGHGDNVVLRNVDDGASTFPLIWHGYAESLTSEMFPTEYYDNGQALVGVALHPKDQYASMAELSEDMLYVLPMGGELKQIGGNVTLYAIWFDVIDQVELTATAPACNTATTTQKDTDGSWNWDSQTNPPELSVPEGSHCHFSDGSLASSGLWNADAAGSAPYVGALTGGNSYLFEGYLESDYGYVFPGESDGIAINCTVNGGSFTSWANESYEENKLYGLWLDPDDGYGTTPLYVVGSIPVEHMWETGSVVQKATPSADGIMGLVCSACGATSQDTFAHPAEITLSDDPCVYDGTAKEPDVTVKDTEGRVVDPSNYDVSYEANTNAGSAKAIVTFKGDYCEGSMEESFTIDPKPITVTAVNASKTYLEDDPELTATVEGLVEGDDASLIECTLERETGEDVREGGYEIRFTSPSVQGNYAVTFVNGTFTINPLPITIGITGHSLVTTFNGLEQSVSGYDVSIPQGLDLSKSNIAYNGDEPAAKGTHVGSYPMGLDAGKLSIVGEKSGNFAATFDVTDGWLVVKDISGPFDPMPVSMTFAPANAYELMYGVDGELQDDGQGGEWFRYALPSFKDGDSLSVTWYDGDSDQTWTRTYQFNSSKEAFLSGDEYDFIRASDITCSDDQSAESPWEVGRIYYMSIGVSMYSGFSCQAPVSIVANPVESIFFEPANPYVLTAHDGPYDDFVLYHQGDKLTVTWADGQKEPTAYTFDERQAAFLDQGGSALEYSLVYEDHQSEIPWKIGNDNYFELKYLGKPCRVNVTIVPKAATITASGKSVAMGKTVKMGAKVDSGGAITYKSSNTKVAKVNATTGVVTPVKAGTANITVTAAAKGNYAAATKTVKVTVTQGTQSLTFKKQTKKLALAKVKKARQTVAITKAKGAKTTVTYKKVRVSKKAANFTVNKTSGKITVKKGTPKGTYKVTVKATAAKTANWKGTSKTAVITITVK